MGDKKYTSFNSKCKGCIIEIKNKERGVGTKSFCHLSYFKCPCKDCMVKMVCKYTCKKFSNVCQDFAGWAPVKRFSDGQ